MKFCLVLGKILASSELQFPQNVENTSVFWSFEKKTDENLFFFQVFWKNLILNIFSCSTKFWNAHLMYFSKNNHDNHTTRIFWKFRIFVSPVTLITSPHDSNIKWNFNFWSLEIWLEWPIIESQSFHGFVWLWEVFKNVRKNSVFDYLIQLWKFICLGQPRPYYPSNSHLTPIVFLPV